MKVGIITIGTEILIGQTIDTNSAWLGNELNNMGFEIYSIQSIADIHDDIIASIDILKTKVDIIIITGGLGPTKDDITKTTLAHYFGVNMVFDTEMRDRIKKIFSRIGVDFTPDHEQQCYLPSNCTKLRNNLGTAPGMWFETTDFKLVSMPGVPYEMKDIFSGEIRPRLEKLNPNDKIKHITISTAGLPESSIAKKIEHIESNLSKGIAIAYLPSFRTVRLRLSCFSLSNDLLEEMEKAKDQILNILGNSVFSLNEEKLVEVVQNRAIEEKLTLATAESCTGGYLAHMMTSISGSSQYYHGSVIAYSNDIKINVLNVDENIIMHKGAVSEETVMAMAKGVISSFGVDIAIATSGIAGPTGGTEEKPVGTFWICVASKEKTITKKLQLGKDRMVNIKYTSITALDMTRQLISNEII